MKDKIILFLSSFKLKPKNINLYQEALTHSSYANENQLGYNYQRLEFLGDAVLQMYTTLYLFANRMQQNEGQLTVLRSQIVREETLAQVSNNYHLNELVLLGKGEIQTGGRTKNSILGDVFEAIVGAIYLDLGQQAVQNFLRQILFSPLEKQRIAVITDYKTLLQEHLQAERNEVIEYQIISEKKDRNNYQYKVVVKIGNIKLGVGTGSSHSKAEQAAAKAAYLKLDKDK